MDEIDDIYSDAFTRCVIGKCDKFKKVVILFNFGQTVDSEKDLLPQIYSLYLSSAVTCALETLGFNVYDTGVHDSMEWNDSIEWTTPVQIVNKHKKPIVIRGYTTHFMDQEGLPVDLNYFMSLIQAGIFTEK